MAKLRDFLILEDEDNLWDHSVEEADTIEEAKAKLDANIAEDIQVYGVQKRQYAIYKRVDAND